jgi:thiamine transporter ThiT
MLAAVALVLLLAWVLGIVGAYDVGDLVHVLLLVALWLFLLAFATGREAAVHSKGAGDQP